MDRQSAKSRVLIFSLRNIYGKALFRCPHIEFEDLICEIDSADLLAPSLDPASLRPWLASRLAWRAPIALNPGIKNISATGPYDILFTICGFPQDLIMFNAISNLRDICKVSVCLLDELWLKEFDERRQFFHLLKKFDVIMLYYSQSVKPLSERIGVKCAYLPPGVDAISLCPYPALPKRVVDVYSIGRRSQITHQKLLDMARETGLFYLHDTLSGSQAINPKEHRALFANVAKRSKYFIVNPGLIDQPEKRGDQIEISNRYFEGSAAGAIMIGERPENEQYEKLFDPDAVIHLPFNSPDIDLAIKSLDRDQDRQEAMRRTGVTRALMQHDWAYRWEAILQTVGLEPKQMLLDRKKRLQSMAEAVSRTGQRQTEEEAALAP